MGIPAARMDHNQAWDALTLSGRRCVSCVLVPGHPRARCLPVDEPFEVLAHVRNDSSLVERVGLLLERSGLLHDSVTGSVRQLGYSVWS